MTRIDDIRDELKGRTELKEDLEEDLYARIAQIEEEIEDHGSIVPTLKKVDFYAALILIILGIAGVIVSGLIIYVG